MTDERQTWRDWHRLFGMLLTDFFTDSPFVVDVERDLSEQQQFLDVVIVRRRRGKFGGALPDGMTDLAEHNLITFKSFQEALDAWAMRELLGSYVAYRKLASPSPSDLLPEDRFRLYAVCARFPQNLSGQIPWQEQQAGVYHCRWGVDTVRVIVAGQLPRAAHNAPLHLFSATPELVSFAGGAYRRHSERTSRLLEQLFERFRAEGFAMSYTMEDFDRQYIKERFARLTPGEQREALERLTPEHLRELLEALPPEKRLMGLSEEEIRRLVDQRAARHKAPPRKSRRKQ
jgi:hypothetical protein